MTRLKLKQEKKSQTVLAGMFQKKDWKEAVEFDWYHSVGTLKEDSTEVLKRLKEKYSDHFDFSFVGTSKEKDWTKDVKKRYYYLTA